MSIYFLLDAIFLFGLIPGEDEDRPQRGREKQQAAGKQGGKAKRNLKADGGKPVRGHLEGG